ncbi:tetratricopeptide repeat protein [Roseovarius phycicola]|uniref:Tetratricopeptide repeat protein n=1 Tax=Roseovarius phycicola TaxID=3080976 RepID=A0ABZ2HCM1_9RHOB
MIRPLLIAALLLPSAAFAKDGDRKQTKPKPTQHCSGGKIWNKKTNACVRVQSNLLDDDTLYGAVREFAYAGQLDNAQSALKAMSDQTEDRVLTYWGFTTRKKGDMDGGMKFYRQALAQNPANITARSYMGQALVQQGKIAEAKSELQAIRDYDGADTWAEISLANAITSGASYNY